jgi:hypothetical protein
LSEDFFQSHVDEALANVGVAKLRMELKGQSGENCLQGKLNTFSVLVSGLGLAGSCAGRKSWASRSGVRRGSGHLGGTIRINRCLEVFRRSFSRQLANEGFKEAKHLISHRLGQGARGL